MPRARAENRLTDERKLELARELERRRHSTGSYAAIAIAAAVPQPVISLARHGRLQNETPYVRKLFEYLRLTNGDDQVVPSRQRTNVAQAIGLLTDGSEDEDSRLSDALRAIARLCRR